MLSDWQMPSREKKISFDARLTLWVFPALAPAVSYSQGNWHFGVCKLHTCILCNVHSNRKLFSTGRLVQTVKFIISGVEFHPDEVFPKEPGLFYCSNCETLETMGSFQKHCLNKHKVEKKKRERNLYKQRLSSDTYVNKIPNHSEHTPWVHLYVYIQNGQCCWWRADLH